MPVATPGSTYDLVQFGATGFTGRLVAQYLATHAPDDLRWAVAGRSAARLQAVVDEVLAASPQRTPPEIIELELDDAEALTELVGSATAVLTTVGPFQLHGEPIVAACARAGTAYADITGEPRFVDEMYLRYQDEAVASGARLVHACGFDSVPHDLGVFAAVGALPADADKTVVGLVKANAEFSGGTAQSAIGAMADMRGMQAVARRRRGAEGRPSGRRIRVLTGPPRREERGWSVPAPLIDPQIVARSAAALEQYGPQFSYDHRIALPHLWQVAALSAGTIAVVAGAAIPPIRTRLLGMKAAGTGPSQERRQRSWFHVQITAEGGGRRVITDVKGGDPGYDETAKMLSETALALAFDDVPDVSGQLTTAVAAGAALTARLRAAGISIETRDA